MNMETIWHAMQLSVARDRWVALDYSLTGIRGHAKGITPKAILEGKSEEEIRTAAQAIRRLDPKNLGFGELLKDAAAYSLKLAPLSAAAFVSASGLIAQLLPSLLTSLSLSGIIDNALSDISRNLQDFDIEASGETYMKFIERMLEYAGRSRNEFVKSFVNLLQALRKARSYIQDSAYEGFVDEVISNWRPSCLTN